MDPDPKFDAKVAVYNNSRNNFVGLTSKDMIVAELHKDASGKARPVLFLDTICPIDDLEPYTLYKDTIESGYGDHYVGYPYQSVTVNNWKLFNYLEEYEQAYMDGGFDADIYPF